VAVGEVVESTGIERDKTITNECEVPLKERERSAERGRARYGEEPKRFMVAHIKESALIESLRGVCSSLLIWLNIPD